MKKTKSIALILGVLIISLSLSYFAIAWTEPGLSPPDGNVPAPLNVGSAGQSKIGGLILNTGGAPTGLIVRHGDVGIGTTMPDQKLSIVSDGVAAGISLRNFPNRTGRMLLVGDNFYMGSLHAAVNLILQAGGSNRMIVRATDGNVGIGVNNPDYKLDILGDVRWSGTLRGGSVPWERLVSFPSACPAGQYVRGVGSSLTCSTPAGGDLTGSGTTNYIPLWTGSTSLGDSIIQQSAAGAGPGGSMIGIGLSPAYKLDVAGDARIISDLRANGNLYVGVNISAPNNIREECEWTAWTCASGTTEEGQICPNNNQFVAGVARGTAGGVGGFTLCGSGSREYYQMRLYCCEI